MIITVKSKSDATYYILLYIFKLVILYYMVNTNI